MATDLQTQLSEFQNRLESFGRRQGRRALSASTLSGPLSERLRKRLDLHRVDTKLLWLEWQYDISLLVEDFRRWLGRVDQGFKKKQ
ncbi:MULTISPECIES: hypothetical protein [unclassified Rhizobium]|uniref:hypothetical protein n=1 Tax=unclassified Rhizobium TaxID=2613769 RepID=UPI0011317365|nr:MULTISPECIES: hypothetical protein [unclassified Rhizobium]